jgi:diguanylate cyclase (GGDEF)-like protein/PAS domain S-box-containing protein
VLARREALDRNLREALVDSRRRYKDLVEVSSDFAWEIGADGAFVFVSPGGALGWQASDLVGQRPQDFLVDGAGGETEEVPDNDIDAGTPKSAIQNSFQARHVVQDAEVWFRCANGAPACLSVSVRPLYDDDACWVGARGICRDVSEDRERDAQLARSHMRERLFGYIVRTMRDEVEPGNMLTTAATAIARALAAQGTEIHRVTSAGPQPAALWGAASPLAPAGCIGASLRRKGVAAVTGEGASALAVATRYQGAVNGALFLWRDTAMGPFADDECEIVTEAAEHLGIALEQIAAHEKLTELSSTDGMTGLLNRRSFMIDLARRFDRATKGGAPGALVYCDLDNFKQVNDTHGHERGDAAICALANILRHSTRGEDLVARLGGDEFALWLEGADVEAAQTKADVLLRQGETLKEFSGGPDCPLGMSLGIAVTEAGAGETLEELMARADIAMYASKKRGKGRATFADPPVPNRRRMGEVR